MSVPLSLSPRILAASLVALLLTAAPSFAQTFTWTGGGPDNNWFENLNWTTSNPDVGPQAPINSLADTFVVLTGNTQTTNVLNLNLDANKLTFDAGAGAFIVNGTNTLTLGAGGIEIASGNANAQTFNANLALGAASAGFINNGTGLFMVGGTVANGGNLLTVGGTGNSVYSGVISGTGGLTKTGAGTVTIGAGVVNTYTGVVTVNAGTLSVSGDRAFGAIPGAATPGKIVLDGGTIAATSTFTLAANRGIAVNAGGGTISIASGQNLTYGGLIAGTGTLTVTGPGKLTVTASNGLPVPLVVSGGATVSYGLNTVLGPTATASAPITLDGGTLENTNTAVPGNGTFSPPLRNIILGPGGGTLRYDTAGGLIILQNTPAPGTMISGVGELRKDGAGIIALAVPATYTGPTRVMAGTLRVRAVSNVFPTTTALTVDSGATFDLSNLNQQVGSLAGAGIVNIGSTAGRLTVGDATSTTFTGVIQGTGGVIKQGTGTLTLGGVSTYTGPTQVSGGTLAMGVANGLASGTAVTVGTGATFDLGGFDQTIASLAGAGNVSLGTGILTRGGTTTTTHSGVISGAGGALAKTGTGTQILTGNNTYGGGTTVSAGTLLVNGQTGTNSGTGTGVVSVGTDGTIGGNGRIGATLLVQGGTIRGGDATGVGTLTVAGDLMLGDNSKQAFRLTSAGSPAAAGSGGSSGGTTNNPANNNFVLVGGSLIPGSATAPTTYQYTIDGTGITLTPGQSYSYHIAQVGADMTNLGTFVLSNPAQFTVVGFDASAHTISLSGNLTATGGGIFLNFTPVPVPEPATVLGLAAGAMGLGGLVRRRFRREAAPTTAA